MYFTRIAHVVARVGLVFGALRVGMALWVRFQPNGQALTQELFGTATNAEAINQGLLVLFVSICLGLATDISRGQTTRRTG